MAIKNVYVDSNIASGSNDGTTWANAFYTAAALETYLEATLAAEDVVWVMEGTITLNASWDFSGRSGTTANPITFIGVKSGTSAEPPVYADWADANMGGGADDRPVFACAANEFYAGSNTKFFNITWTSTSSLGARGSYSCLWFNCKFNNSSGSAGRHGLYSGLYNNVVACESQSLNGHAMASLISSTYFCYFHDSDLTGVLTANNNHSVVFCIFNNCGSGVNCSDDYKVNVINCTFYNCVTAVSGTTSYGGVYINNIIDTVTDGFKWTTQTDLNFLWNNHEGNAVTDMWDLVEETLVAYKDNAVSSGDPKFVSSAGGNFAIQASSPLRNAGMSMKLGVS